MSDPIDFKITLAHDEKGANYDICQSLFIVDMKF